MVGFRVDGETLRDRVLRERGEALPPGLGQRVGLDHLICGHALPKRCHSTM